MTVNADMREFWNADAGNKWVRFQEKMDVSLLPLGRRVMDAAEIKPGARVLDIGCGCGATSLEMAARVGAEGQVLGLDISQPMLDRAKARLKSETFDNLRFEQGDAQTAAIENGWFDIVFSRFGVMFFEDPTAAFSNLRRALKPGGRVAFICWRPVAENEWVRVLLDAVEKHISLPAPPEPGQPGPFSFGDDERLSRILREAGLERIGIEKHSEKFAVAGTVGDAAEFFTQMGPTSRAITNAECDDSTLARIIADFRSALAPFDTGQGVELGTATWIVTAHAP